MLISSYNDNTLMLFLAPSHIATQTAVVKDDIAEISDNDQVVGYNFLNFKDWQLANGPVTLNEQQISELNQRLVQAGFAGDLVADETPKLVIGYVQSVEPHPDSDHLQITKTQINAAGDKLQIVSGSPNMTTGIKVVVATPGTVMPSGQIIWPGALRGVESNGMIVSGRELHLPGAPEQPGALILPDDFAPVGTPFDFEKGAQLFN